MNKTRFSRLGAVVALAGGFLGVGISAVPASAVPQHQVFVGSCGHGGYPTITAAVNAVAPGGIVHVCPGTYVEDVTVNQPVTIQGFDATVAPDPSDSSRLTASTGQNNGFTVLSPGVTISGFTVTGATGDGILVLGDHALIEGNTVLDNGLSASAPPGNGINLDGSSYSTVRHNTVSGSGNGGIQLANDPDAAGITSQGVTGTATHDVVVGNDVVENPYACGILLVDHAGSSGVWPDTKGIYDNVIQGNVVLNNAIKGYGAGILLATGAPGGAVYDNVVSGNEVAGNGLAGLTLHSHLSGQDLNGNVIVGNDFGTNNLKGLYEEPSDPQTTGVFVGSKDPLTITVQDNTIHDDYYGVFTAGPSVTVDGLSTNTFTNVTTSSGSTPVYIG